MITDLDVKKLLKEFKKVFATKDDLQVFKDDILNEFDSKLEKTESNFDKKLKNLREEIAQDFTDAVGPFMDASDDHDKRIRRLEKHTSHPPVVS